MEEFPDNNPLEESEAEDEVVILWVKNATSSKYENYIVIGCSLTCCTQQPTNESGTTSNKEEAKPEHTYQFTRLLSQSTGIRYKCSSWCMCVTWTYYIVQHPVAADVLLRKRKKRNSQQNDSFAIMDIEKGWWPVIMYDANVSDNQKARTTVARILNGEPVVSRKKMAV
jgi:hypothetical protein